MSEDMDKQEQASPFKLQEARKKGQVGRSAELVSTTSLVVMLIGIIVALPALANTLFEQARWWFANAHFLARDEMVLRFHSTQVVAHLLHDLAPIIAATIIMIVVVSIAHAGPVFSTFPLRPDFSKMNPAAGFKKIFSRKNLIELFKLLLKLIFFVVATCVMVPYITQQLSFLQGLSSISVVYGWRQLLISLVSAYLFVFVLFALIDLFLSKREFARQMRMSRRDVKDEHKRHEGDPAIKSKRRRIQMELMQRLAGMKQVKNADVIVTNPTHVAVALRYRPNEMVLPITLTMGRGLLAKSILLIARRHRIPVLRRPPLARALARHGSPGAAIPLDLQNDVAALYRWVVSLPGNKVFTS